MGPSPPICYLTCIGLNNTSSQWDTFEEEWRKILQVITESDFTWNNELRNLLWDSFPAGVVPDAGASTAVSVNGNIRMLVGSLNNI
jgi:hypothetical protein